MAFKSTKVLVIVAMFVAITGLYLMNEGRDESMPRLKSANFAVTELAAGINDTVTSFVVDDASAFPDAGPFMILVHDRTPGFAGVREIMEVGTINKGTDTFSDILRGKDGTTPMTHAAEARVECVWSAGTHEELADDADLEAHKADNATKHTEILAKTNINAWIPRTFTKHGSPLLTFPAGVTQLGFPCVLKVSEFLDNPVDDYYMWCGPHDDPGGIHLFTAPAPEGPWTHYGLVLSREDVGASSHIASPHAVWVAEEKQMYLYFHALGKDVWPNQPTYLAFTPDGKSNFTLYSDTPVIPVGTDGAPDTPSASYARVVRIGGDWLAFYQGGFYPDGYGCSGNLAYSRDGKTWTKDPNNAILAKNEDDNEVYLPTPLLIGNTCYLIYRSGLNIKLAEFDGGQVKRIDILLTPSAGEWDSAILSYPFPYIEGNKLYLYYAGNNALQEDGVNISVAVGVF